MARVRSRCLDNVPRVLSWLSWAREDDRDLSVIVYEPDVPDFKCWGKAQALAGSPSDVPKNAGPQTEASHGCLPWEDSSELCEHLDGFSGVQIPWTMLVLPRPD